MCVSRNEEPESSMSDSSEEINIDALRSVAVSFETGPKASSGKVAAVLLLNSSMLVISV
jgi:hypothetical protein